MKHMSSKQQAHWNSNQPNKFQTSMCKAGCADPCCCALTCVSCTYGTSWCLRRKVLDGDWSKYQCCQGFCDVPCCDDFGEKCASCCGSGDGRCCCMCLECICCPGLAISSSRLQLMVEYALVPEESDNQIIRFNNCMQCLACFCQVLAWVVPECRQCATIVRILADIVFLCTASCMAAQINKEKNFQIELADKGETNPNMAPGQMVMASPAIQQATPPYQQHPPQPHQYPQQQQQQYPPQPFNAATTTPAASSMYTCLLYTSPSPRDS
eukprot:TRINITY_DN7004_c0_g1_i12.p1 TRINITY_DN7004_c0_g1~~TRINITY_DN7004_c0_g1_i12.p1  ORF type:complete len:268 (+),score=81.27 TRINITY_DN7004_c0_g1_i12:76-879(+)